MHLTMKKLWATIMKGKDRAVLEEVQKIAAQYERQLLLLIMRNKVLESWQPNPPFHSYSEIVGAPVSLSSARPKNIQVPPSSFVQILKNRYLKAVFDLRYSCLV